MQFRRLGRTDLQVSLLSLGSGGPNRFGQARYRSRRAILGLVRRALELGVNFFDTAPAYGASEKLLGAALRSVPRDRYLIATKLPPRRDGRLMQPGDVRPLLERSLTRLGVETVDLLQLHRVTADSYAETMERLMPELDALRQEGKFRFLGITESSLLDPEHRALRLALADGVFDTIMVTYHPRNPLAADALLPAARAADVGVIAMASARHLVPRRPGQRLALLSRALLGLVMRPPRPAQLMMRLQNVASVLRPLFRHDSGIRRSPEFPAAGYRFAVAHPAVATVLTGTTDVAHLEENVAAVLAPRPDTDELRRLLALARRD